MTYEKDKTCCFTGHRNIPSYLNDRTRAAVSKEVEELIGIGYDTFVSGGALGFDLIAAEAVIDLKARYPWIKLIFAIPCYGLDQRWSIDERLRLSVVYRHSDDAIFVSTDYGKGCMLKRNRYMVDNSSVLISYCTRNTGGSAYTVSYAQKNGLKVIEISDKI